MNADWAEYLRLVSAGVSPDSAATLVLEQRQRRIYAENLALARRSHDATARHRAAQRVPSSPTHDRTT